MGNEYIGCPEAAAAYFAKVKKSNYLAHTIREIEREIRDTTHIGGYHIIIQVSAEINDRSRIYFCEKGCDIFLPIGCEEMDDRSIRLVLAHELGHILYNFDRLQTIRGIEATSEDEEFFSWKYHNVKINVKTGKSMHPHEPQREKGGHIGPPLRLRYTRIQAPSSIPPCLSRAALSPKDHHHPKIKINPNTPKF